jgi:hypothetical protein
MRARTLVCVHSLRHTRCLTHTHALVRAQVDCITDRNGSLIFNEIRGEVNMRTKLSGMPECQLTFINPR